MSINILLPILIIISGSFFLFKIRFFFIKHPIRTLLFTFKGKNTGDAVNSLLLALAGTIGVGNIIGVLVGLRFGGSGSVFWLMISAIFSSAIKYSEVCISAAQGNGLGFIGVTRSLFPRVGLHISRLYAALCIGLSFFMGCAIQSGAVFSSADTLFDIDKRILAVMLLIPLIPLILFGKNAIKKAVAITVPLASGIYIILCLGIVILNISRLPSVLSLILKSAFDIRSFSGGIAAFLASSGIKEGFARGLLSNEAGAGTSSFAHTALSEKDAERAGCFGIFEVIFDTLIICPLTAFAALLGLENYSSFTLSDLSLVFASHYGRGAMLLLFFCILAFAISTIVCWYYYGSLSVRFLFGGRSLFFYFMIFLIFFLLGAICEDIFFIAVSDILLLLLSIISLSALIKGSDGIKAPSDLG